MEKIITVLLTVILNFCLCSGLLSNELRFRQFSTKDGFPLKDVNIAMEDKQGYMWFGTYDGVLRFDGTDFKSYMFKADDTTSLGHNNISEIFVDNDGDIFIGGEGFLCLYNKTTDDFTRIKTDYFKNTFVNAMVQTDEGTIYLATYTGLFIFNKETLSLKQLPVHIPIWEMYLKDSILYLGTQYNGLLKWSVETNTVIETISSETNKVFSEKTSIIFGFAEDSKNNLWFSGNKGGLYKYNLVSGELEKINVYIDKTVIVEDLHAIYIDSSDRVWLANINNGLIVYNPDNERFEHYTYDKPEKLSITSNSIWGFYEDSRGTVWVSTHFGGVCYLNNSDNAVEYVYREVTNPSSLGHNVVSSFGQDKSGGLWVGTDGGGLFFRNDDGSFEPFNSTHGLHSNAITQIDQDAEGDFWISQWQGGVQEFDPNQRKLKKSFRYNPDSPLNLGSEVKGVFCDKKNRIWMFAHFEPLQIYDQDKDVLFTQLSPGKFPPALFEIDYCRNADEDASGNIWITSSNGLYRYSDRFSVKHYINIPDDSTSLVANTALNVYNDSKNRTWVITPEGLELYNPETEGFIHISALYNFPKLFYSLIEDEKGRIWFTSKAGLGYFIPESMEILFFDRNVLITGDDFITRSDFLMDDGSVLLGSTDGYIKLFPNELKPDSSSFNTVLTELQLFNEPEHFKNENSILKQSLETTSEITLQHNQSVLSIRYSALFYTARDQVEYAYFLEGFDKNWNHIGADKKATYTNLPPGEYIFKVKAKNIEGVWSSEKELKISVLPPWWSTWWFRLIYIMALIMIVVGVYLYKINQQKKLNKTLTRLVEKRTEELTQANQSLGLKNEKLKSQNETISAQSAKLDELNRTKDKFFSIIAHDLKNPMHTILGFSDLLLKRFDSLSDEKKMVFISSISDSSQNLFTLMDNLLEWSRSQLKSRKLEPVVFDVYSSIHETLKAIQEKAQLKEIEVRLNIPNGIEIYADKNMFETVIRNLLTNSFKFTKKGGMVAVKVKTKDSFASIVISDTGVGMDKDQLDALFKIEENRSTVGTNREKGTGLGLILCKDFVDQNKGTIRVSSRKGKGTSFTVDIPLNHII